MSNQLALVGQFDEKQLATIKSTIAKGTTDEQFALFVQTCQASGLNPFLNHIHCIVYNTKDHGPTMSIQIAVEGIQYLARQKEGYKGIDTQLVHENDDFKVGRTEDGKIVIKNHEIGFPRGKVIGGYSIAKREGFDDVVVLMEADEVEHMKKGRNAQMWGTWFNDMFKKHLAKRAAKQQFGIEIAEDEAVGSQSPLNSAGSYTERPRVDMGDITSQPQVIVTGDNSSVDQTEELERQRAKVKGQMEMLGWKTADLNKFVAEKTTKKKASDLSLQELVALTKLLDFEINTVEEQQPTGDLTKDANSIYDAI